MGKIELNDENILSIDETKLVHRIILTQERVKDLLFELSGVIREDIEEKIERASVLYEWENGYEHGCYNRDDVTNAFIAGVKSDIAREYWLGIFDQLKR
jgi:hypothetical protein